MTPEPKDLTPREVANVAEDLFIGGCQMQRTHEVLTYALGIANTLLSQTQANVRGSIKRLLREDPEEVTNIARDMHMSEQEVREKLSREEIPSLDEIIATQEVADILAEEPKAYDPRSLLFEYKLPKNTEQKEKIAGYVSYAAAELAIRKYVAETPLTPTSARAVRNKLIRFLRKALLAEDLFGGEA